ncbi:MAG: outer membrane beta-barrel protein [Acidobacteria bacterium]|nr:outer membrane beta-barrel protein [Acidobacteriota bacterium]
MILRLVQPAAAQSNTGQMSVGFSFLQNDELAVNQSTLPWGFFFDSSFKLNDWISLAGELNGHFKRGIRPSDSLDRVVPPLSTQDFQALSFNRPETGFCSATLKECQEEIRSISGVGGPRFYVPVGHATPFVHVMAGATRSLRKIDFFAHTSTNFTVQVGGGVDVDVTPAMALHLQGDYRRVFFGVPDQTNPGASLVSKDGADYNDVMFSLGMAFKLGRR